MNLNSLKRFAKESDRLLLEQFDSCEVPAGCGGAIIRWRNPEDGQPLVFLAVLDAEISLTVDGRPLFGCQLTVPPGDHLLGGHFTKVEKATGPLLCCAVDGVARHIVEKREYFLKSAADDTWLATTTEPDPLRWTLPDYDDSQWTPLAGIPDFDPESVDEKWRWRYTGRLKDGILALEVPSAPEFWLRKRFHLAEE